MLATKYRFHGHGSLRFVYSKGQAVRSKYYVCKYTHNARRSEPRVAIVVSKKVIKSAVKRNRIRRRLYEAVRQEIPKINPQLDLVFVVISPEVLTAKSIEIAETLQRSLTQADLYKTTNS